MDKTPPTVKKKVTIHEIHIYPPIRQRTMRNKKTNDQENYKNKEISIGEGLRIMVNVRTRQELYKFNFEK